MDEIIFGTMTFKEFLLYAAGAVVLLWVLKFLVRMIKGKPKSDFMVRARCMNCRWEGNVSKYKGVCPKCGNPVKILERRR